jgi:ribose transport system ATP-binding protein
MVRMMAGREVTLTRERRDRVGGADAAQGDAGPRVALAVRGLGGKRLPIDASFELCRGEILGIGGLIGAGRTELLRAIFGLDAVRRGEVRVAAFVGPASPARRLAQRVGFASEDRKGEGLALALTVADNVTLAALGPSGFGMPARAAAAARKWIDELGIKCRGPDQPAVELSGGNQQKLQLARLLHCDADVLLLDEPTRGIDVAAKAQIARLVSDLAARGKAVLLVSSSLPELLQTCDRIAVMCRGRLGQARPAAELDQEMLLREAVGA